MRLALLPRADEIAEHSQYLPVSLLTYRLAPFRLYPRVNADCGLVQPPASLGEPNDAGAAVTGVDFEREGAEALEDFEPAASPDHA